MFKQSHIALSGFLADEMQIEEITRHRKSLSIGSVLPDVSPRQRARSHEFSADWDDTIKRIRSLAAKPVTDLRSERIMCRRLGMILHYLSDYFTCPHNPAYRISMRGHCMYEGIQAYLLRGYLKTPEAKEQFLAQKDIAMQMHSIDELIAYIERLHDQYMRENEHQPQDDCRWIVDVCACTAMVLLSMVYENTEQSDWLCNFVA